MEKIKPSASSTHYVQNIYDKTTSKQEGTLSCTVQMNNWLHPDIEHFPRQEHCFFTGHNIIPTIPVNTTHLNINPKLPSLLFIYNYSKSTTFITQSNVTPCSTATCKSIGSAPTDKVYHVLFDSDSSKTQSQKCIIPWNFTPIPSTNDLQKFLLAGATTSMALVALNKIRFPEFNCNVVVDKHPALIVDSTSLWYDIIFAVDFIGPWPPSTPHGTMEFFALTCINTTTNLVEIAQIFEKSSDHVSTCFEHTWLYRYPKPMQIICDNGGKFTGFAFQHLLQLLNIKPVLTTNTNPQANAICKWMHQTVTTVLKHSCLPNHHKNTLSSCTACGWCLGHCHTCRAVLSLNYVAGHIWMTCIFSRHVLNIPLLADWQATLAQREKLVNDTLLCANKKRFNFDYQIGQKVLK